MLETERGSSGSHSVEYLGRDYGPFLIQKTERLSLTPAEKMLEFFVFLSEVVHNVSEPHSLFVVVLLFENIQMSNSENLI
jgi:hypothetical protein